MDHTRFLQSLAAAAVLAVAGCVTGSDSDPITGDVTTDATADGTSGDATGPDGAADSDATTTPDAVPDGDAATGSDADADATACCQVGDECIPLDAQCPDSDPNDCSESYCSSVAGNLSCVEVPLSGGQTCGNAACGGTCGTQGCVIPDAAPPGCANVNLIFTSSMPAPLDATVTALDAHCAAAATDANLPGTRWVAWASATGNLVKDRIGPNVAGWVRVSDNHEPVAQSLDDLADGDLYYPPLTDENKQIVTDYLVATGTLAGGDDLSDNCASWTVSTSAASVQVGHVGAGTGRWMDYDVVDCGQPLRVVCLQADFDGTVTLPEPPDDARLAFVTDGAWTPGAGVDDAHAACQAAADAAPTAPQGTYKAFLALDGLSPAAQLSAGPPFVRPDGLIVFDPANPDVRHAPMALRLDGTHSDAWAYIGAVGATVAGTETCDDWSSASLTGARTRSGFGHDDWLGITEAGNCSQAGELWCFQVSEDAPTECTGAGECDDGLACTSDTCNGTCVNEPQAGSCVIDGTCYTDGQPNIGNACEVCDASVSDAWSASPDGTVCDDGDPTTSDDTCQSGVCAGVTGCSTNGDCDDGLPCTEDTCNGSSGVCNHVVTSGCLIGNSCVGGGASNPGNPCETCQPSVDEMAYSPDQGKACDDGQSCTTDEICNASGQCVSPGGGCTNVAFLTNQTWPGGALGGVAGADAKCNTAAMNANPPLQGTFVALIATTSSNNASLTTVQTTGGWVRPDGLPVAANIADLLEGRVWYSPGLNEVGDPVGGNVWTGLQPNGNFADQNCSQWSGGGSGMMGLSGVGGPEIVASKTGVCNVPARLLCLQVDAAGAVSPPAPAPPGARRAFLSSPVPLGSSVDDLDDACNAQKAGLEGQFSAFVATVGATPASRIDLTKGNFFDPVGVQITSDPSDLATGQAPLNAPLIRGADGNVYSDLFVSGSVRSGTASLNTAGSPTTTCDNWNAAASAGGNGVTARAGRTGMNWFFATSQPCADVMRVVCLQNDSPPNVIFVSSQTMEGDMLGGSDNADTFCADQAADAGLDGAFVAVMSGVAGDLQARLSTIQGGFVRPDGKPVAKDWQDLLAGTHWYAPNITANDVGGTPIYGTVWTGSNGSGVTAENCAGWIQSSSTGAIGELGAVGSGWLNVGTDGCGDSHRVLCVQTDAGGPAPLPSDASGRYMFVSTPTFDPAVSLLNDGGIAGAHAFCQTEAEAAGSLLPDGLEWRALLPLDDEPPIEDVDLFVTTPYTDPVGVIVVNDVAGLGGNTTPSLYAPLWRRADGTTAVPGSAVIASDNALSANTQENCSEWTDDTEFLYESTIGSSEDWYAGTLKFGACAETGKQVYCYSKP